MHPLKGHPKAAFQLRFTSNTAMKTHLLALLFCQVVVKIYSLSRFEDVTAAKLKELKREWKEGQYLSKLRNGRFVLELLNFCRMVYKRLFRIKLRWNVKLRCSIPVREICRLYWFQENLLLLVEKYQISARTVKVKTITIQLICPKLNVQRNEDIAYPGVYRNFSINIIRYLLVTYCYSSAVVALP